VLVVDDDDGVRRQLTYLLEDEGYHVRAASTGYAALSAASDASCDVVILDVRLPDLSGLEVFEAFRRRSEAVKTIIVSGFLVDDQIADVQTRGAHFLAKPLDGGELLSLLDRLERAKGDAR
jgi:DNA-binding response OmpR family regulator